MHDTIISTRTTAIENISRARREDSVTRLREAAERTFLDRGYLAATVEDIAQAAGVSRKTFYRHLDGKFALVLDLYERESRAVRPLWLSLADKDFSRREVIVGWITTLFAFQAARRNILRTFVEMGTAEPSFVGTLARFVPDLINELGETIPAFARTRGDSEPARRRWVEAWLLLDQLMTQCSTAAIGIYDIDTLLLIDQLAGPIHRFVSNPDQDPAIDA